MSFFTDVGPDAQMVAKKTGVPASVILAQWAIETGRGTSPAFRSGYNYAGISSGGRVVRYSDKAKGLQAYIATLLSPRYEAVRSADTAEATAKALGDSPWAASHYGGGGRDLLAMMTAHRLASWDSQWKWDPKVHSMPGNGPPSIIPGIDAAKALVGADGDAGGWVGAARKLVLTAAFVATGLGLMMAGAWRAAPPEARSAAKAAAGTAKVAAA
ncbi:MAG: glucosaminidase domain-containing protein [Acidimicrobiales bacterium]